MNPVIPHSLFTEYDIYLFKSGKHFRIYEKMGSHIADVEGETGVCFAVWAPNAQQVSVVGNFNHWNQQSHPLLPRLDESGIWEGFIPGIGKGELYKYHIQTIEGRHLEKGDPYAFFWEIPPNTASIVWDQGYHCQDAAWLERRQSLESKRQPSSVYAVQ